MKVFLWKKVDAMSDWLPGMCFAHADTLEQAIDELAGKKGECWKLLRDELESKEPEVYEGLMSHCEMGSA